MYKWHLEKENHKFTCPHCGEKKRFKRYVYEHNGEYIDETVGIFSVTGPLNPEGNSLDLVPSEITVNTLETVVR